jgi:hypothetical protein
MTHSKCGLLLLLAAGVVACGGDPTDSFRESDQKIVATPSIVFVDQGSSVFVIAERQDAQGNQLTADFEPADIGPGITVVRDTTFVETTNGTVLKTRDRFIVTGLSPQATSFNLQSGDLTLTVPVKVTPINLPATFSTSTPAFNEPVTVSAAGYHFLTGTTILTGADTAVVLSIAPDSTSVTFLPFPGTTGPVTISGIAIDFLPSAPLTLTTTDTLTVAPLAVLPGSDSPSNPPVIAAPSPGITTALFDSATFASPVCGVANAGVPCQLYKISLPTDTVFDATLTWPNGTDLGLYVLNANGTADTDQACDAGGNAAAGGGFIEACTITLPAGDYLLAVVNFGPFYDPPDPAPNLISLRLSASAPAATP